MAGRIVVGTSSWTDPGFVEEWYPPGLPARDRLAWYAERFEAVEVNSSFYAVPERRTVERWVTQTPDDFTFDVKLHRVLSRHAADLKSLPTDVREVARTNDRGRVELTDELQVAMLDETLAAVEPLAEHGKLSSFLLQLSPAFKPKSNALDELEPIVGRLAPHPVAIELRHRGWVEGRRLEETLGWLSDHRAAFVCTDSPQGKAVTMMPPVDAVTRDDLAYFRAHGRNVQGYQSGKTVAERFAWDYGPEELQELRGRAEGLASDAEIVRVMFNNNRGADAPKAAERMRELLGQVPA
ncbi:MAG: DUF72 domain-containing protein [Actinomycetota bacterium]|nr:DUF72 domain-containing protein [Actinomycetota bacterium]